MLQRKKKLLRNYCVPKKGKPADKVPPAKERKNYRQSVITWKKKKHRWESAMPQKNYIAQKEKDCWQCVMRQIAFFFFFFLIQIWSSEKVSSQYFPKSASASLCLWMILDNDFRILHLRDCAPCALTILSSFIAFSLKYLHWRELRAILRNSQTRAE